MWAQLAPDSLRHLIDNLPAGLVVIDENTFMVNCAVEKICGYTRAELSSIDRWFELLYREKAEWNRAKYESRKLMREPGKRVLTIYHKSGDLRQIEITAFFDDTAECWHLNDITEQMSINRRFELVFTRARDGLGILETGTEGLTFKNVNPSALYVLGEPDEFTVVGRSLETYLPTKIDGHSRSTLLREVIEALGRGDESYAVEYDHHRVNLAPIPVRLTFNSLQGQGQHMVLATWHDLTEERQIQAQSMHNSKMVSLGEMSSGLAHELNTPLAVIKGKAQSLLRLAAQEKWDHAVWTAGLNKVDQTVNRMSSIVAGLRSFARDSSQDPHSSESLHTIIEDTLAFCASRFKQHGVTLREDVDPTLRVVCRPSQISQVLLNLLNNALDVLAEVPAADRWVEITAQIAGSGVVVCVRDGGPGVPAEFRSRIMQPFFTTKAVGKGTGLGLSISSGILSAHGSELSLDADAPHTSFRFVLPRANA